MSRVEELLSAARSRIDRLTPLEARAAASHGALIIDIRSDEARQAGVVPGSLHLPRTVLEWRADPACAWHNPHVGGLDRRLIVLCEHGESSSFAAASLVDLGFRAADVIGGFEAWQEASLAVATPTLQRGPGERPGMGPPEPAEPSTLRPR